MRNCAFALLLFCGGCYGVAVTGRHGATLNADQITALKGADPATAAAILKAMSSEIAVAGLDMLTAVERTWALDRNPATGQVSIRVTAAHKGDAEMLKAIGDVVAGLVQAAKPAAGGLPSPPAAPATGGVALNPPAPGVLPAGAPAGATLHVEGGPWLGTDLLRPVSVHQVRAMEIAAAEGWPGKTRATAADLAQLRAGLMTVSRFAALVADNWTTDPRVR